MPLRKIQTWPQAVVACAVILAVSGIGTALILAGWSSEAIIGFVVAIAGIGTGQFIQARKTAEIDAKTDQQTDMLARVVDQTNLDDDTRDDLANRVADKIMNRRGLPR